MLSVNIDLKQIMVSVARNTAGLFNDDPLILSCDCHEDLSQHLESVVASMTNEYAEMFRLDFQAAIIDEAMKQLIDGEQVLQERKA